MRLCWASSPPSGKAGGCARTPLAQGQAGPPGSPSELMCCRFKDTLVNTVGHRVAERALQLGLLFPPAEALRVGVVDQVVPEDQVQSAAQSVLAQWLAVPGEELREGPVWAGGQSQQPHSLGLLVRAGASAGRGSCARQKRASVMQTDLVLRPPHPISTQRATRGSGEVRRSQRCIPSKSAGQD